MRWRIEPAGPATVRTCGLVIPRGGIERELDEATVQLLSGDARVTVTPGVARDARGAHDVATPAAPRKGRGRRS